MNSRLWTQRSFVLGLFFVVKHWTPLLFGRRQAHILEPQVPCFRNEVKTFT